MIKVLIVEDSIVAQKLLSHILDSDPNIEVIGTVGNGRDALEFVARSKPDVITMDINLPDMSGIDVTREIMETDPVPIVVISAVWNPKEVETTFEALQAGALAMLSKPSGPGSLSYGADAKGIVDTVKTMSEVKLVRRSRRKVANRPTAPSPPAAALSESNKISLVAIGVSTGGPPLLEYLLSMLPKSMPVPVVVVQHITVGFLDGLVSWLASTTGQSVHIAADNERLLPGHFYFAPDDYQMAVGKNRRVILSKDEKEYGLRPSVSYLFRSLARSGAESAIGVLLTGMGRDGAMELKLMKDHGAVTIAQNKESSVIYGMPGAAIELGAATFVLSPEEIVKKIEDLVADSEADDETYACL